MATLDEMTNEVLSHQFSPSQYDTFVRAKLNEAEIKLLAEIDFRVAFTSTVLAVAAGWRDYFLPDNFQRVYTVRQTVADGRDLPLTDTDWKELDLLDTARTGAPEKYALGSQGGSNIIRVWPMPDQDYSVQVRYYGEPGTMTDGDDEPLIPERWQDLLVRYALIKCYERENDYNSAQYHQLRYDLDKEKAKGQAQYDADDYSQASQVGDDRVDPLAPNVPYIF